MDEDYGFEYSDEEQDEEQVDVENQYYNAKGSRSPFFFLFFLLSSFSLLSSLFNRDLTNSSSLSRKFFSLLHSFLGRAK